MGKEDGGVGAAAPRERRKGGGAPPPLKRAAFRVRVFFFLYFFQVFQNCFSSFKCVEGIIFIGKNIVRFSNLISQLLSFYKFNFF